MKIRSVGSLILAVLLLFSLVACQQAEPTPTDEETATKTTATTTTTTTTTIATTTTTTATTTTTTTTTTTSTTKKRTTRTYENTPYEAKDGVPGKDKHKFLLNVWGEDVEMVYDKMMIHPHVNADDERLWYYNGTTKKGTPIQCRVNADTETLAEVEVVDASDLCNIYRDKFYSEEDVRAVMDEFFEFYNLSAVDDTHWTRIIGRCASDGTTTVNWYSSKITLADEVGHIYGKAATYNKKLQLTKISFYVDPEKCPLVIPRWITE